jgi:hypothetical protein
MSQTILRQSDKEFRGNLVYKQYKPGDGYTYEFVFCRASEIQNLPNPEDRIFIAELSEKMKAILIPSLLLTECQQITGEAYIRDAGNTSPEIAKNVWRFLSDEKKRIVNSILADSGLFTEHLSRQIQEGDKSPEQSKVQPRSISSILSNQRKRDEPKCLGRSEIETKSMGNVSVPEENVD